MCQRSHGAGLLPPASCPARPQPALHEPRASSTRRTPGKLQALCTPSVMPRLVLPKLLPELAQEEGSAPGALQQFPVWAGASRTTRAGRGRPRQAGLCCRRLLLAPGRGDGGTENLPPRPSCCPALCRTTVCGDQGRPKETPFLQECSKAPEQLSVWKGLCQQCAGSRWLLW